MKTMKTQMMMVVAALALGTGCAAETGREASESEESIGTTNEALSLVPTYRIELGHHGGMGGSLSRLSCASGDVIVGMNVEHGQYINEISIVCARLRSDGTTGPRYTAGRAGSPGPKEFKFVCPEGTVLTGVRGRAGTYLDNWGGTCINLVTGERGATWDFGGWGGTHFNDTCPSSYAITTLDVRSASWVDGVRAYCTYVRP